MNAELPSIKNGEHNSESASTIDRVITPLSHWGMSDSISPLIDYPVSIHYSFTAYYTLALEVNLIQSAHYR